MTSGRGGENYGCGGGNVTYVPNAAKRDITDKRAGKLSRRPPTHHPGGIPVPPRPDRNKLFPMADLVGETPPVSTETSISVTTSPLLTDR